MRKGKIKRIAIMVAFSTLAAGISLSGYSYGAEGAKPADNTQAILILESVRQNYLAQVRLESLRMKNTMPAMSHADNPANVWLKRVMPSEVNMVTNRYTNQPQSAIRMNGKVYYTSGEPYIMTLKENPSIRFAKDPITGMAIDKAEAAIYIDASGRALYFSTDDSFKNFIALAESDTAFGYSKPK